MECSFGLWFLSMSLSQNAQPNGPCPAILALRGFVTVKSRSREMKQYFLGYWTGHKIYSGGTLMIHYPLFHPQSMFLFAQMIWRGYQSVPKVSACHHQVLVELLNCTLSVPFSVKQSQNRSIPKYPPATFLVSWKALHRINRCMHNNVQWRVTQMITEAARLSSITWIIILVNRPNELHIYLVVAVQQGFDLMLLIHNSFSLLPRISQVLCQDKNTSRGFRILVTNH